MSEEIRYSYISKAPCGCFTGAIVDQPKLKKEIKDFMREAIDAGEYIERVTVEWVREHGFEKCAKHADEEKLQPSIFESQVA